METSATPLAIAHVDAETGYSGGEVQVMLLLEGLRERGHRNLLICPPGAACGARAREGGHETLEVPMRNDLDLPAVWRLRRAIEAAGADLVHLHTGRATRLGAPAARLARRPALATRRMDRPVVRGLRTRLVHGRWLSRTVAISEAIAAQLRRAGVPESRLRVIPSAVDPRAVAAGASRQATRQALGAADDVVVMLTAASLHHRKGLDVLLDAAGRLAAESPVDFEVWIAGEGPERAALEARAAAPALAGHARLLGRRTDVPDLLGACDVFVLPARAEGLGVAALEAMAAGRPVVASRVGGLADAVVHEQTGLLVPPDDSAALARALGRMLAEPALRERLGAAGPARVADGHRPEQMVGAYEALYREVLAERGARVVSERAPLSACIVAMDEADRIAACLRSLAFCDEIVLVDSHSSDLTREIAAEHGARVIERDWPGHVAQKEFAIRAAAHDWVLCVDADERISEELRAEIETLRDAGFPGQAGWRMPRLSSYFGRPMRHGGWYPDRQLRLFDRRRGRWAGRDPHDRVELDGPVGRLASPLLHDPYRSLADHLRTIDSYTTIMAEGLYREGRRTGALDLALRPFGRFLRFYLLKRGFLEGWRGLLQARLAAHYVHLKYAKLRLLERDEKGDEGPPG